MRVVFPVTDSVPLMVELPAFSPPNDADVLKRLVEEEMLENKVEEVACWKEELPKTVRVPFAESAPPTVSTLESVVEPVTAKVPEVVAPVVVSPPLKASWVVVALLGKR